MRTTETILVTQTDQKHKAAQQPIKSQWHLKKSPLAELKHIHEKKKYAGFVKQSSYHLGVPTVDFVVK